MSPEYLASKINQADRLQMSKYMNSIELKASQEALFDLWETYIGEAVSRGCGKCRVLTVNTIRRTMKFFK